MGADHHEQRHKNRLPPFVPLLIGTLGSPAWRAMSHGAKILYIALRRRYNSKNHNNGKIYLSQRKAHDELRSHHNEIAKWFRELQHYGFIVMMTPAYLGFKGRGKAPHWRLTELGYMKDAPTHDFMRWDGRSFQDVKAKTRAGKPSRSVSETRHTNVQENRAPEAKSVPEKAHISSPTGAPETPHIIILPYATAQWPPQRTTKYPVGQNLKQPSASPRTRVRIQNDLGPNHANTHRQRLRIIEEDDPATRN